MEVPLRIKIHCPIMEKLIYRVSLVYFISILSYNHYDTKIHKEIKEMRKFIVLLLITLLAGCHMYRPDVQQGNVVTQQMASRLHSGMSQSAAKRILGNPLLINTFTNNRLDYVYTYKHGNQPATERQIILTFKNNRLVTIRKKLK